MWYKPISIYLHLKFISSSEKMYLVYGFIIFLHLVFHPPFHPSIYPTNTIIQPCVTIINLSFIHQSVSQFSRSVVSDSLRTHELSPTGLLRPWDFSGKNTGVGCHFLLQGNFQTQGSNPGLLHCRQTLYSLSHRGSPFVYLLCRNVYSSLLALKNQIVFLLVSFASSPYIMDINP